MFTGSMVALVTPMTVSGEIDFAALTRLLDWHIKASTDAIVILGSTGEAATLSFKERETIVDATVKHVDGRVPVMVGTGTNCTRQTLDLTRTAKLLGADAALVVTPFYNKPTQAGLIAHYEALLEADFPIMLYNVPGRTAVDMLPETVLALAQHKQIIGIKESSTLERLLLLLETAPDDFLVVSGDDATALESMKAGAAGVISVAANVVPESLHAMTSAVIQGNIQRAAKLEQALQPLFDVLFVQTNPIPVKWAVHELGMITEGIRLPLLPLEVQYRQSVQTVLNGLSALGGRVA